MTLEMPKHGSHLSLRLINRSKQLFSWFYMFITLQFTYTNKLFGFKTYFYSYWSTFALLWAQHKRIIVLTIYFYIVSAKNICFIKILSFLVWWLYIYTLNCTEFRLHIQSKILSTVHHKRQICWHSCYQTCTW